FPSSERRSKTSPCSAFLAFPKYTRINPESQSLGLCLEPMGDESSSTDSAAFSLIEVSAKIFAPIGWLQTNEPSDDVLK
ncbi:MAG: hypothetical protein ACK5N9_18750, partial [Pirellula sp.]